METSELLNSYYGELRRCLDKGFYADNFESIYQISYQEAGTTDRPLFPLLMWATFRLLYQRWYERPLDVVVASQMENALIPPIRAYLDVAEVGLSAEDELAHLNQISQAHSNWLKTQDLILYGRKVDE